MPPEADLKALKNRLAPRLLAIDGVTGLGTPGGVLVVYLENDSAALRREVDAALRAEGVPETHVVVTEGFKAQ
ncbi:MAG: hypothetical protein AUH30_00910 [Candidatus Rokubacteria bacterium 13_1_40CM_68_15]|nr:MAG: hypothetical protein AUH30_00910 [Candidatus Rokubacteria bacterium 13_1_40CM_68_15]